MLGTADRRHVEVDPRPFEPLCRCLDIAMLQTDIRAESLQPFQMLVDGSGADGAAAGKRHPRPAVPGQKRPENQHRGAHGLDQIIGRLDIVDRCGVDSDNIAVPLDPGAERLQHLDGGVDVAQKRHIADLVHPWSKDCGTEDRQRCILGAADRHLAGKLFPALDNQFIQLNYLVCSVIAVALPYIIRPPTTRSIPPESLAVKISA